jgi:hypothetical protein
MTNWLKEKTTETTTWIALTLLLVLLISPGDTIPAWTLVALFFVPASWLQEQVDTIAPVVSGWIDQLKGEQE